MLSLPLEGQGIEIVCHSDEIRPTDGSLFTDRGGAKASAERRRDRSVMPGQIVHFEIPADDTAKGREFWGSLFGWGFEPAPGQSEFEYHMTQIGDQAGLAI